MINCVYGPILLVVFDDCGSLDDVLHLGAFDQIRPNVQVAVVIKGQWHTVLAPAQGAVLLEAKAGPVLLVCAKNLPLGRLRSLML